MMNIIGSAMASITTRPRLGASWNPIFSMRNIPFFHIAMGNQQGTDDSHRAIGLIESIRSH